MNRKKIYQLTTVSVLLAAAMEAGCSRSYSVTAVSSPNFNSTSTPAIMPTNTWTNTPGNTSTSTNTPTVTPTNTSTNTAGQTFTNTNTPTNTATNTMTDTPTNTATNTATSTATQVTFTYIYTTYIQPNSCSNCHGASGFPGPPDPSSQANFYNSVVNQSAPDGCTSLLVSPGNASQSALYLRLSGTGCSPQMPESGGFILSAAQLADVAAWINEGALNN